MRTGERGGGGGEVAGPVLQGWLDGQHRLKILIQRATHFQIGILLQYLSERPCRQ
jgi:hypothetical protein